MSKHLIFSFLLLSLFSCKKIPDTINNINGGEIEVLSHAGENQLHPWNSFPSIEKAMKNGADGVEVDVQVSNDSVLVLYHEAYLDIKTKGEPGRVEALSWDSLKQIEYKRSSHTLIHLDSVINGFDDIQISLDLKPYTDSFSTKYIPYLVEVIARYNRIYGIEDMYIESTSKTLLKSLYLSNNNYQLFYYTNHIDSCIELGKRINLTGISIKDDLITQEDVEKAHDHQLKVMVWDIYNANANNKNILKHVDIIQTDALKHLVNQVK